MVKCESLLLYYYNNNINIMLYVHDQISVHCSGPDTN